MNRFLVGFCMALTLAGMISRADAAELATDRILLPPERREVASPTRAFTLVLTTADAWRTPYGSAELYRAGASDPALVWRRDLPHHHGPRRALVSDQGTVLLADEWINVPSRYALTLIDPANHTLATYSADQVFAVLGVPLPDITAHAKAGPWITDGPRLSTDGQLALIKAGGRTLEVNLADGGLSAHD